MRFLQIATLVIALISIAVSINTLSKLNDVRKSLEESQSKLANVKRRFRTALASKWPKFYDVNGKLLLKPGGNRVIIDHEEIPGVMQAMIMSYEVDNPKQIERLEPGDRVRFKLKETEDKLLIINIEKAP
jgi:Cu/Ag efflux protein CusF